MPAKLTLPAVEILRNIFRYEPETGCLYRKPWASWIKEESLLKSKGESHYILAYVTSEKGKGLLYKAHRLIWAIYYGVDPGEGLLAECEGIAGRVRGHCFQQACARWRQAGLSVHFQ